MFDIFTAILLSNHLSRRHFEAGRRSEREPLPETESAWARVFTWHRRRTDLRQ